MADDLDLEAIARALRSRAAALRALDAGAEGARRPVELDQTRLGRLSRTEAMQDQAMALATERRRAQELRRIEAALHRLAEGEYGYCTACGEAVEAARLKIDPTLALCLSCARGA